MMSIVTREKLQKSVNDELTCKKKFNLGQHFSNNNMNSLTLTTLSKNHLAVYSFWINLQARRIFLRLIFC